MRPHYLTLTGKGKFSVITGISSYDNMGISQFDPKGMSQCIWDSKQGSNRHRASQGQPKESKVLSYIFGQGQVFENQKGGAKSCVTLVYGGQRLKSPDKLRDMQFNRWSKYMWTEALISTAEW